MIKPQIFIILLLTGLLVSCSDVFPFLSSSSKPEDRNINISIKVFNNIELPNTEEDA